MEFVKIGGISIFNTRVVFLLIPKSRSEGLNKYNLHLKLLLKANPPIYSKIIGPVWDQLDFRMCKNFRLTSSLALLFLI